MKLNEIIFETLSPQNTIEIMNWMRSIKPGEYEIEKDYIISRASGTIIAYKRPIFVTGFEGSKLPFKFGCVSMFGVIECDGLRSFENFPEVVSSLRIESCPNLTSFIGIEKTIKQFTSTQKGYEDVPGEMHLSGLRVVKGGLGLVHIRGLKHITVQKSNQEFEQAINIISKFLDRPDDIFECQAELIEAGLEAFAEL